MTRNNLVFVSKRGLTTEELTAARDQVATAMDQSAPIILSGGHWEVHSTYGFTPLVVGADDDALVRLRDFLYEDGYTSKDMPMKIIDGILARRGTNAS